MIIGKLYEMRAAAAGRGVEMCQGYVDSNKVLQSKLLSDFLSLGLLFLLRLILHIH